MVFTFPLVSSKWEMPMMTPTHEPPTLTLPQRSPDTATHDSAVSQPATQVPAASDEPRPYWGDRIFVLLCLGCALVIILMNGYDFLKGLLGY